MKASCCCDEIRIFKFCLTSHKLKWDSDKLLFKQFFFVSFQISYTIVHKEINFFSGMKFKTYDVDDQQLSKILLRHGCDFKIEHISCMSLCMSVYMLMET